MRILVLNHEYPPIGGGGGKACQDVALELSRRGHEVRIITSHSKGLPVHEDTGGVKINRLPVCRREAFQAGLMTMGLYVLRASFMGWRIIREWKPQLIHVHFAVPAGAAALNLHRLTGIPYLLTTHLGDIPGGSPQKTQRWFRWIYPFTKPIWKNAAAVTTVSAFTQALADKQYGIKPTVIPNGIEINVSRKIALNNPPVILFAGRFAAQKNLELLVDVLKRIKDLHWHSHLLGDGPLFAPIKRKVTQAGLADRVTLPGWVPVAEVERLMEQADILFMPSLTEGLPVVGLQALKAGLVIVASKVGGFIDLVEPGKNGNLLEPADITGFEKELRRLLSNEEELLHARLHSLEVVKKFAIERIVDSYEGLMQKVLERKPERAQPVKKGD